MWNLKRFFACFFVVILGFNALDYSTYAVKGNKPNNVIQQELIDGNTRQSIYVGENFRVTFKLTGQWDGGYNASVRIDNTGVDDIQNWYLSYDCTYEIQNIWNAEVFKTGDGTSVIKNVTWNQDITTGSYIEYGFSGSGTFPGFPTEYKMVSKNFEKDTKDYSVEYHLDGDWGSGFIGSITIYNNTDKVFEDWSLEFNFDRTIVNIWNGVCVDKKDNHYLISNSRYRSNIEPHQSITFGISGIDGSINDEPYDYKLFSYEYCNDNIVTFDLNYELDLNTPEKQIVEENQYVVKPEDPSRDDYVLVGWYTDTNCTEEFDFDTTLIDHDITLYAKWFNYVETTDTDGDLLIDTLEEIFKTDVYNADTDHDGLSDYIEIVQLSLDPLKQDTDEDGIFDGCEDYDLDGLNNLDEIALGTELEYLDTDYDDINDYEEVYIYKTDPLLSDTDGDGVSDGKEIEINTDPLSTQDYFNISEAVEEGNVKASVDIELSGEQVETLKISQVENESLFSENIPGYIGDAYNFSVDGTFDSATISFVFDEDLLSDDDFEPTIYYFNESDQQLEEMETTIQGNVASAEVEHFSTYILINRKVYADAFKWIDVWDTNNYTGVEIVLVIDDSGSMISNDANNTRLEVAQSLVNNLPDNSKIGVVKFTSSTTILTSELTNDKEEANRWLTTDYFHSSGGTYMYSAIDNAFSLYESDDPTILKMMVVISDGASSDTSKHTSIVSKANNNSVKIYTVGLGSSTYYFNNYLQPLANNTAGVFYLATNASQLSDIYEDINQKIDIETDSDNDGIPDYYEDNMVIFNGVQLQLDKNNPDTDGDGLLDGEEIVDLNYYYNEDKTKVIVTGKMKSNPASIDSDGDGLYDNCEIENDGDVIAPKDPEPLIYTGEQGMWKYHITYTENETVATEYSDIDSNGSVEEKIRQIVSQINVPQEISDLLVRLLLKIDSTAESTENIWGTSAILIKYMTINLPANLTNILSGGEWNSGQIQALLGSYFLNFITDADGIAYHSQVDTWQRSFGYNTFYDLIFKYGSNITTPIMMQAVEGDELYALWLWKGDYWNLQNGAEIGLYEYSDTYDSYIPVIQDYHKAIDQYHAVDFELPMSLSLYKYSDFLGLTSISNVFSWYPSENQWWITGFSGFLHDTGTPQPDNLVSVGTVDFTGHEELLNNLKKTIDISNENQSFIFDEDGHTLWIMWR